MGGCQSTNIRIYKRTYLGNNRYR